MSFLMSLTFCIAFRHAITFIFNQLSVKCWLCCVIINLLGTMISLRDFSFFSFFFFKSENFSLGINCRILYRFIEIFNHGIINEVLDIWSIGLRITTAVYVEEIVRFLVWVWDGFGWTYVRKHFVNRLLISLR